jgi:hypothetical protein
VLQLGSVTARGERNRLLTVVKSRGMRHSNQMREYLLTDPLKACQCSWTSGRHTDCQ